VPRSIAGWNCDTYIVVVFELRQGPIITVYVALFAGGALIRRFGVITPPLLSQLFATQPPPVGFTVILIAGELVQNSVTWLINGVIVLVTGILSVVVDGQTVALGDEFVL